MGFFDNKGKATKRHVNVDESTLSAAAQFATSFADVVGDVTEDALEHRAHEERQAAKSRRQRQKKREGGILSVRVDAWVKDVLDDIIDAAGDMKLTKTDALHVVFERYREIDGK